MRLLIAGCGYLGLRCAGAWVRAGHDVLAVTRSAARAERLREQGISPIVADLVTSPLPTVGPLDGVLYAVGYDRQGAHSRREVAISGLRRALDAWSADTDRWIYISSTSVYSQSEGEWVDETSPCRPTTEGGECCLAAEQLLRETYPDHAGCSVILRLAGIYGPDRLLSRVEQLQRGEPLAGRGDAWLNLIHVDDAAAAVRQALTATAPPETCIVCDDHPVTRHDYYSALAQLAGAPPPQFDPATDRPRGGTGLNKRLRNARLKQFLLPRLQFPSYNEGLNDAWTRTASKPR